jgi:hypothetical protein
MPIPLRADFDAQMVRSVARRSKDGPQARRLLALAAIHKAPRVPRGEDRRRDASNHSRLGGGRISSRTIGERYHFRLCLRCALERRVVGNRQILGKRAVGRRHEIIDLGDALRASVTTMFASTANAIRSKKPTGGMCLDDIIKIGYFRRSAGIGSSFPDFVSRHRIGLAGTVRKAHIASQAGGHPRGVR